MIQDDEDQMCSNNGENSIVRSSKILKKTKVPQRGLGVAQLEKIRIEEQQKKVANFSPPPTEATPSPLRSLMKSNPPSLSGALLKKHSMPNIENGHTSSLPSSSNSLKNGDGFSIGWPSVHVNRSVNLPMLRHHEFRNDHVGENSSFLSDLTSLNGGCSIANIADVMPNAQYYKHYQSSSSLVNDVSSTNLMSSSTCSSLPNLPLEFPSNQLNFTNYLPSWVDEQKVMFGSKRPYPFLLDDPAFPVYRSTFAPKTKALIGVEESTSCQNEGAMHNLDLPIFRDAASCLSGTNGNYREEHTLASSTITSSLPNFISKQSSSLLLGPNNKTICKYKVFPYQEDFDNAVVDLRNGGSSKQPKCIGLFPSTKLEATSTPISTSNNGCHAEIEENIDLNLRL